MSKLYAIRQTGKSNYWYDFVEDFTSVELNRDCISNNFTYVKECQNNLETLNPAWKNSEIVEFRELGEKDDFEDLYYKSLEQRADLEAKLAERDAELNRYAELFGMKDKDFYVVEKSEYDKMKQGAKDIIDRLKLLLETERLVRKEEKNKLEKAMHDKSRYKKNIEELKQQLAGYEKFMKENNLNNLKELQHNIDMCGAYYKDCEELSMQLVESEEAIKYLKGIKRYDIGEMLTENTKLKQQLAESEEQIWALENQKLHAHNCLNKLKQQLAESEKKLNQYPYKNDVIEKQYEDLKDAITFLMLNNIKDQEQLNHSIDVLCEKHKKEVK